ncbi:MAG: hypothetical protein HY808_15320, partial [Nitrospirae bacterium]|nr:hypothetical protein [Nitrospirota bacterium]
DEISGLTLSEDSHKGNEAELYANLHATEALIEEKKRICVDTEKHLNEVKMQLYSFERETTEDEGKIALLKSDCENLREKIGSLQRQDGELDAQKETAIQSIKESEDTTVKMKQELTGLEAMLADKNDAFLYAEEEIKVMERDLEVQRKGLFNKAEDISNMKNEMNHLTFSIENIIRKAEKSSQDITSLNDSLLSLQTATEETKNEHLTVSAEVNETKKAREDLANKLRDKKSELSTNEESLYREREELAGMASRLDSLSELNQLQRTAVDEHVKALCQVADIFETTSQYETAIEAILGDKLNAAIVEDRNEIARGLQFVKEQKSKRSGFIAANSETHSPDSGPNFTGSGVIGAAINFVTVKDDFQKIAAQLLSDVMLVDNLDTAFSLRDSEAGAKQLYLVTLDGEVLEPSGVVFGGSGKEVLKIKRMIKELEQDITVRKGKITEAERVVLLNKEEIVSIENEIISTDGKISSQEKYCHTLEIKITNLIEENERLKKKHDFISLEITDDHAEKDNLKSLLDEKDSVCRRLEEEKQGIEEQIRSVQEMISGRRESLEVLRSELTEIKLNLASTREKMASIRRENERLTQFILDIEKKKEEMADERVDIEQSISHKEREVVEKENTLKTKIISVSELQNEVSKISDILEAKTAELSIFEQQQKSLASELDSVRTELNHIEMKKMELSMKLNYLKEDIRKTYLLEIDSAEIADTVSQEEEEKLSRLKDQIQEIGPVSLGTLDEYEELKSRHDFLTKQRDDLLAAIDALQDTIQKINKTTQTRLTEAFTSLNEKFREVFTTLFGKGRAELHLTDEGNILDSGIEIVAQPPGKRLQNLMLLSGGEKALTALSLLFAGFMIKPTPLCILDEVDAPLDESNTDRFIHLLKEMSKGIQFITITHNRRTMEAAQFIYGITMEEPGSSKAVSMQLAEAV